LDPLYKLTKKNQPWDWTAECQTAFEKVKAILTSAPALCIYEPTAKTRLFTDASRIGVGAVLKQEQDDGEYLPIGYFSRRLLSYQRNYSVTELELLAIVEALDYWHYYLIGIKFEIYSDHEPLKWLSRVAKTNSRLYN